MSRLSPYKYICIEGNIGSGKTSLCEILSNKYPARLVLEEFDDNPFLPFFYQNPERYAFTVELFFMAERHKQLSQINFQHDLFYEFSLSDYCFWKTLIFARKNLDEKEYRLFQRLFNMLNANSPNPELLIYLHRTPKKLLEQINLREREYETGITSNYLQTIQDSYFEFFYSQTSYPIVIVDMEDLDFINDPIHLQEIEKIIFKEYRPGLHRVSLRL
ncbi:MAG TPA: deoxynucleoside kinase [Saprospiraceae bacterium]|nr:deoxynucleoside kinase [Saprospiraceae bacterium]